MKKHHFWPRIGQPHTTPICVLWDVAIFMINYLIRLWSQGGDVTYSIIFECERCMRNVLLFRDYV